MQLHKVRVAADWANLRAYYSEIQTDYIVAGKSNPEVPTDENDSDGIRSLGGVTCETGGTNVRI